jgi:SAM-dependent methyltransferase
MALAHEAASPAELLRDCPQCGGTEHRDLDAYSHDRWRVVACLSCNFVYLHNVPVYERLTKELAWEKTFENHAKRVKKKYPLLTYLDQKTRWRLHLFRPDENAEFRQMFPMGPVLDVGCGSGTRAPEPFVPYGVEISEELAARADAQMKARGGACVQASAVEGVERLQPNFFSGVLMRSFLEHEAQPKRLLAGVRRVLRDDGVAFVKVPNYGSVNRSVMGPRWCGFRYPDHVNYFTLETLTRMASETGFKLRLLNPLNLAFDDNIHATLTKA